MDSSLVHLYKHHWKKFTKFKLWKKVRLGYQIIYLIIGQILTISIYTPANTGFSNTFFENQEEVCAVPKLNLYA